MNSGRQWKQLASGSLPAVFFSSSNHDLKVVCFSTVQSYSVHKNRCFPSSFVRMTCAVCEQVLILLEVTEGPVCELADTMIG